MLVVTVWGESAKGPFVLTPITTEPPPPEWGVAVDAEAVDGLADRLAAYRFPDPAFDYEGVPDLDPGGWCDFAVLGVSVVACLWAPEGEQTWEIDLDGRPLEDAPGMWACFTRHVRHRGSLDPAWFRHLDERDGREFFAGRGTLQLVPERVDRLRAVAAALGDRWDGRASALVDAADGDAGRMVDLLVETVPGYLDRPETPAGTLQFDKLARLAVAMIGARVPVSGLERFPVYPDYMLPRHLRYERVLRYEPALAATVDTRREIAAGSSWEHAIRWATVHAGERLLRALHVRGNPVSSPALDYHLWWEAVLGPEAGDMGEHHRTVTLAY
jgi:hypothetical protein